MKLMPYLIVPFGMFLLTGSYLTRLTARRKTDIRGYAHPRNYQVCASLQPVDRGAYVEAQADAYSTMERALGRKTCSHRQVAEGLRARQRRLGGANQQRLWYGLPWVFQGQGFGYRAAKASRTGLGLFGAAWLLTACEKPLPEVGPPVVDFCAVEEPRRFSQEELDWRSENAPSNLRKDFKTNTTYDRECAVDSPPTEQVT